MFGRLVRLLTGRHTRERLAAIEQLTRKSQAASSNESRALGARVSALTEAVRQQPTAKDVRELRHAVRQIAATVERAMPRFQAPAGQPGWEMDERRVRKQLDRMASNERPILIGPWSGEVGFELLYWIPFVEWVRSQWELQSRRQIVISRGGVASWYHAADSDYEEIFSTYSPEEFRIAIAENKRKQRQSGALDQHLIDAVRSARHLAELNLLHPSMMYRLFERYWSDDAGYARIDQFTRYRRLEAPENGVLPDLPAEYAAVRFYFSECFPDTPANRAFARTVVDKLAEHTPVVLLNPGFSVDDHSDWAPESGRVVTIDRHLSPASNLSVQSAVIARARTLIGSYGGYSYLAPFYGVPAVSFYSRPSFKLHHLHAAQRAFERLGAPQLSVIDVRQAPVVQSALGGGR
jgi:hypothetical protein